MPQVKVHFFMEEDGSAPVLEWLKKLKETTPKAYAKCYVRIERLKECGNALRRPEADYLRDGIYELRAGLGGIRYRLLYFFHGRNAAVLAHSLTKEKKVPDFDIDLAVKRKNIFMKNPTGHIYKI